MRTRTKQSCVLGALLFVVACGPTHRKEPGVDAPGSCAEGTKQCDGNSLQTCTDGAYVETESCANACDPQFGCVVCVPNTGTCNGNDAHTCRFDGSGYVDETCDPVQGSTCDPGIGGCTGPCASATLGSSYIGCDYFPTITGNMVSSFYEFAVAIANTSSSLAAMVTIDGGALGTPMVVTVPPSSVVVQKLPWQGQLKLCVGNSWSDCLGLQTNGAMVVDGAYHLRSTVPITLYQFSPLDYSLPGAPENSFTNDASLMTPTNTWRRDYYVASWQQTGGVSPSEFAVTAYQDNTMVTITTKANTDAVGGAPAFTANVPQVVTLNAGDVLELATITGDLTGSHLVSDKPIQVIGAHFCANIPDNAGFCDHIEESMFSTDALAQKYIISAPALTSLPNGKEEMVRIIATAPNTTLTYEPPQAGAPTTIANPGDFVEIPQQVANYQITASEKVLVAQYMEGSSVGGGAGDPAMALAVPVEQFRSEYLFHAPTNYESNYVDIISPMGSTVTLDGAPIPAPVAIGATNYGLSRVQPLGAGPGGNGNHSITGTMPFGITVYGYGQDTSYWYPGGLDLSDIVINKPSR